MWAYVHTSVHMYMHILYTCTCMHEFAWLSHPPWPSACAPSLLVVVVGERLTCPPQVAPLYQCVTCGLVDWEGGARPGHECRDAGAPDRQTELVEALDVAASSLSEHPVDIDILQSLTHNNNADIYTYYGP